MKPENWVKGMQIVEPEDLDSGRVVHSVGPDGVEFQYEGTDSNHTMSFSNIKRYGYRPATYSDLNRTPAEGERAVRVEANPNTEGEKHVGKVAVVTADGRLKEDSWYSFFPEFFAPLTESREGSLQVDGVYERALTAEEVDTLAKGGTVPGNLLEPAKPTHVKCAADFRLRPCYIDYLTDPKSVDPCSDCALLIDQADYWIAWYSEMAGKCHECRFTIQTCVCARRSLWGES